MKIYKYPLQLKDRQILRLPSGAEILSVQMQGGQLCLWAIVEPERPETSRIIEIIGTGFEFADYPRSHISTAQNGGLVWHVFEDLS